MKRYIVTLLLASVALFSCEKYETIKKADTDFKNNYEFFWNLVDEQYCYLDYKNIDWEGVKQEMMPRVEAAKNEFEFFKVLTESLDYLRDGHVGLITPFNRYGCSTFLKDENGVPYPSNFESTDLVRQYLVGKDLYRPMDSDIRYGVIEDGDRTYAYIMYDQFDASWTNLEYKYLGPVVAAADGIIIDVRENPGGSGELGLSIAGNFFDTTEVVGYYAIKASSAHNDFTAYKALYAKPSKHYDWSSKPTMLLTNRGTYSTANLFTCALQYAPNVTIIGGKTGGGGGLPLTHYLPNGWMVAFPSNVLLNRDKEHIENGIDPDILIDADSEFANGRDIIIERAIEELGKK